MLALVVAALPLMGLVVVPTSPAGAVTGGSVTSVQEHPWQVAILRDGAHMCGGVIVNRTSVVTAAHCLDGVIPSELVVRAGVTGRMDTGGQDRQVRRAVEHPRFRSLGYGDVGVLRLRQGFTFGPSVRPLGLATSAELATATEATVTGWGSLTDEGRKPFQLRGATIAIVDDRTCSAAVQAAGFTLRPVNEVCAGSPGAGSCFGDSGGPLVIRNTDGTAKLAGLVSWGPACGTTTPNVFTEVPLFTDWITRQAGGALLPKPPVDLSVLDGIDWDALERYLATRR